MHVLGFSVSRSERLLVQWEWDRGPCDSWRRVG